MVRYGSWTQGSMTSSPWHDQTLIQSEESRQLSVIPGIGIMRCGNIKRNRTLLDKHKLLSALLHMLGRNKYKYKIQYKNASSSHCWQGQLQPQASWGGGDKTKYFRSGLFYCQKRTVYQQGMLILPI